MPHSELASLLLTKDEHAGVHGFPNFVAQRHRNEYGNKISSFDFALLRQVECSICPTSFMYIDCAHMTTKISCSGYFLVMSQCTPPVATTNGTDLIPSIKPIPAKYSELEIGENVSDIQPCNKIQEMDWELLLLLHTERLSSIFFW